MYEALFSFEKLSRLVKNQNYDIKKKLKQRRKSTQKNVLVAKTRKKIKKCRIFTLNL